MFDCNNIPKQATRFELGLIYVAQTLHDEL